MPVQTGAGVAIYIGTTASATNLSEYQSDTYTQLEQVESIGSFGDSTSEVTFTGLSDARVQKLKGSQDAGNLSITMALDETSIDSSPLGGQGLLLAASQNTSSDTYNFYVEYNDAGTSSPNNGTRRYFSGQVATFVESVDGSDSIIMIASEVRINTAFIRAPAGT
jgi:hypothetical protein